MGSEIERKFLVRGSGWKREAIGQPYRQGYLSTDPLRTVRVRIVGEQAYLTIKGQGEGLVRPEFEYPIPLNDALQLLGMCLWPLIEKTRYRVEHGTHLWEIDEFAGENSGLVVAEVELQSPDEAIAFPEWVGEEVTGDPRYLNANLGKKPFSRW